MNWKTIVLTVVILVAVLFIVKPQQRGEQTALVLKEVGRLIELNRQQNLTMTDLTSLRLLVATSKEAQDELKEVEFFALYGERKHVDHSLPRVYSTLTGMEVQCPLDDLAHASVYLRYNAEQPAMKSFIEARKTYPNWLEKVEETKRRFPSTYPKLEEAKEKAEVIFSAEGLQSAAQELRYMEENGFC